MRKLLTAAFLGLLGPMAIAQSAQPIKIGGSFDASGPSAVSGTQALEGVRYAVETLNKKGGVLGRPLVLEVQDNGTNPQRAVNQSTAIVGDGAVMLIAPISSGNALAVSKTVSAKSRIPMCNVGAGASDLTMKDFQPYIFSVAPSLHMMQRAIARQLATKPFKRYAVLAPDYVGGRTSAAEFMSFIKEFNPQAEIVVEEYPKFGATDYTASINKILAAKPDYVWSQLFGSDLMTFSKQARAVGFFDQINRNFIALYEMNTLKNIGETTVGTDGYQAAPVNYLMSKSTPDAREFITRYKADHGIYPADYVTLGYDCVMVWAEAANAGKSTDADAVMHAIEAREFHSARGPFRFGKNDHMGEIPIYFGKVALSKEFGQAMLNIDAVVPGSASRPTDAALARSRQSN